MSSELIVPVVKIEKVRKHSNADALELCNVLGYQMCIRKDQYKSGDKAVYFPSDTLIPAEWADKFGVRTFLKGSKKDRVSQVKLRGEPSFGLIVDIPDDLKCKIGDNVADFFGALKYEPPIRAVAGDAAEHDELDKFVQRYTKIQNGRIFTDVFEEGEEVSITEKLHGTSAKCGIIKGEHLFAASMGRGQGFNGRRKRPQVESDKDISILCKIINKVVSIFGVKPIFTRDMVDAPLNSRDIRTNTYWFPWSIKGVEEFLKKYGSKNEVVTIYGEIFGGSIQELNYGIPKGEGIGFKAFDIAINGKYISESSFKNICNVYEIPIVPELYRGTFDFDKVLELSSGKSTVDNSHIREGVVVKPIKERTHPKIGRVVLKYIGDEYMLSKHKENDNTDV